MKSLTCPVCSLPLRETENNKSLTCANGHLFDKAKQGYINLLLSHKKKSKQPGDTPEMVASRTRFLDQGYYEPVANTLSALLLAESQKSAYDNILYCDIACGEGYYTQIIHHTLSKQRPTQTTGFDISTPAVKAASKRDKSIQWLIASANNIPLEAKSHSLLTCLFCRVDFEAAAKIAAPEASFIVAETGPQHLIELRQHLYDEVRQEEETPFSDDTHSFSLSKTVLLTQKVKITGTANIIDLLTMTPHYWRVKADKKQQLAQLDTLDATLDIRFHILRKD